MGPLGTVLLTTIAEGAQGLGLTRMSLPYFIGSMFTADRDRARVIGVGVHLVNGWVFALLYIAVFHALGGATWWRGLALATAHAAFVLAVVVRLLPAVHPRMASENQEPTVVRRLEPPGFLAMNYGYGTPITIVVSHLVYELVLGGFYAE